jgi:hypothetical protein
VQWFAIYCISCIASHIDTRSSPNRKLAFRSPKWEKLHSQGAPLHETKELKVTLKNVKSVAIDCINSEHIRQLSVKSVMTFDLYFKSEQIDIFLCYLLLYMDTFFKLECHGSDSTRYVHTYVCGHVHVHTYVSLQVQVSKVEFGLKSMHA